MDVAADESGAPEPDLLTTSDRHIGDRVVWASLAALVPLTFWVASLPTFANGLQLLAAGLAIAGWTMLGLGWIVAIWLTGTRGHLRSRALTRWVLPPLVVGVLGIAAAVDLPERARFAASHAALDALARDALAEPNAPPQPDRAGRYDVDLVEVRGDDVLVWLDGGFGGPVLVHIGSGPFDELEVFGHRSYRCAEVASRWWQCNGSDF